MKVGYHILLAKTLFLITNPELFRNLSNSDDLFIDKFKGGQ